MIRLPSTCLLVVVAGAATCMNFQYILRSYHLLHLCKQPVVLHGHIRWARVVVAAVLDLVVRLRSCKA